MEDKGRGAMRGMKALVVVLILLSMVLVSAGPVFAEAVGPYDVSFVTMQYNYPEVGYSTWYYTVTSPGDENAISHLVLELGACCSVVDAGEWEDYFTLTSWWNTGNIEVTQDPTTGVFGIKFDDVFAEGETRNYYFTVEGNHALEPDKITVAIKSGGGLAMLTNGTSLLASVSGFVMRALGLAAGDFTTYYALIDGPNLLCETTAVSLSSFSAVSPPDPSAASLLMPGSLLAALALIPTSAVLVARRMRREEK
jgi:hypothetical protein